MAFKLSKDRKARVFEQNSKKEDDDDLDPIEIINAIRYCIGKDPIPETGKKRIVDHSSDDLYASDFDLDLLVSLGLDK